MSTRLADYFQSTQHKTLIPYISAGDPSPAATVELLHALVRGGADILELGVPFSDPTADGETIQRAHQRALAQGMTLAGVFAIVAEFRRDNQQTPVILMGYLNSFERFGFAAACTAMQRAGVDGVILVDCPVEALPDYEAELRKNDIVPIMLVAPTTTAARRQQIVAQARGFIYFVSLRGVTGKNSADADAICEAVEQLRRESPVPVCIGFGIRDGASARKMAQLADGVIIGSALVAKIAAGGPINQVAETFMRDIRHHLDS